MGIRYLEKERIFALDTPDTTYLCGIVSGEGFLGHLYYGKKLEDLTGAAELYRIAEHPYTPDTNNRDRGSFYDCFPFEYSSHGVGDYRESSIAARMPDGTDAVCPVYESHQILKGKREIAGLPSTFGEEDLVSTLIITCRDRATNLKIELSYSVFEDVNAITRSVRVINETGEKIYLKKAMSLCLDMEGSEMDVLTLHGSWARERVIDRKRLGFGKFSVSSQRGESSHQEHPFLGLLSPDAGQTSGEVYGFHFVYSGNFLAQAQRDQFGQVRVVMGIHPESFCWELLPGAEFLTPEAVMVYSDEGLGGMTRTFHNLYRKHLIRSPWLYRKRPVLINNWEATYFDFDADKILGIAKESAKLGIEMLVLDDGWFGNRFDDNRALGDWQVNEEKLKGGLGKLVSEINALGMKFGLWIEPEMISPDSKLYEAHPDWAIKIPGREPVRCRNQYVLDISRKEVRDHILQQIFSVLHSANIEYVKWDMNRPLCDLASAALPPERQGELSHRFALGMYEMQERLLREFPELLLENCSGGGGRFDPGMLYYSPQIWCSDDTDAVERLKIQEGTALLYPLCSMGAHVSVCPNHTVGRSTPFETRGMTALAGTFGYELDVTKLSEEEKEQVKQQVRAYHAFGGRIREGDYYRLASYMENRLYDCYEVLSKDRKCALVFFVQVLGEANLKSRRIRLQGLKKEAKYAVRKVSLLPGELLEDTGRVLSGAVLMNAGLQIPRPFGDFKGILYELEELTNV